MSSAESSADLPRVFRDAGKTTHPVVHVTRVAETGRRRDTEVSSAEVFRGSSADLPRVFRDAGKVDRFPAEEN